MRISDLYFGTQADDALHRLDQMIEEIQESEEQ